MTLEPKIIFEDDQILVLDKPPGLVVDKSETQQVGTLEDWLSSRLGSQGQALVRNGIVHRLDKDTSGLLIVAKTTEALENLQAQFKERTTKKEYLALVHGNIKEAGVVEGDIGRNPGNREKFAIVSSGKPAITEYQPIQNFQFSISNFQSVFNDLNKIQTRKLERLYLGGFTLVRCFPKTGRTHQIRVHLKYIGFPIVSDEKYVGRKMYRLDKRFCPRQFLHAAKISFIHPKSGEQLEFESSLPEDLDRVIKMLDTRN